MKSSMLKKLGIGLTVTAFCGTSVLMAMASTSVITEPGTITEETLSDGVTYRQEMGAKNDNGSQNIFTVTYDYTDPNYDLAIGGNIGDRNTVTEMAQMLNEVCLLYTSSGWTTNCWWTKRWTNPLPHGLPMAVSASRPPT